MKLIKWLTAKKLWANESRSAAPTSATDPHAADVNANSTTDSISPDDDLDPFNPFPEPVTIEITDVIDLHTIPARDVRRVVEEYLHQVHKAKFQSVRIIHGKGIGVQRRIVISVLADSPCVLDWTDAPPDAGGLGATVVRLVRS